MFEMDAIVFVFRKSEFRKEKREARAGDVCWAKETRGVARDCCAEECAWSEEE